MCVSLSVCVRVRVRVYVCVCSLRITSGATPAELLATAWQSICLARNFFYLRELLLLYRGYFSVTNSNIEAQ